MINVGIYGATGYMGGELIRICLEHPRINIKWATSRNIADGLHTVHPNLYGHKVNLIHPDDISPCDAYLVALPIEAAIEIGANLLELGGKLIDLSAAFRLKQQSVWESVYEMPHPRWDLAQQSVYGITELHKTDIAQTRLVANPGCFSSAVILGLAPLLKNQWLDEQKITVTGLSGTAGVGAELSKAAHHPEIANNLVPYNVVDHRHSYEMEQELGAVAKHSLGIHFTPVYVPIVRGILAICHVFPKNELNKKEIAESFESYYAHSEFVKFYDCPKQEQATWQYRPYPWVSTVAGTNYCFISYDIDYARNRLVVFSVLDNLGKGGAHVAIENLNIMFGLNPKTGLSRIGCHPV